MTVKFAAVSSLASTMALAALISCIAACSRDARPAALQQCIAVVEKEVLQGRLPNIAATHSSEERHDKMGNEVASCMAARGYLHDNIAMVDERCVDDVEFTPYCYRRAK